MSDKKKVEEFVARMEAAGVLFVVKNGIAQAENISQISGEDLLEMVRLHKSGALTEYLSQR